MAYKDAFSVQAGKVTRKKNCPKCGKGFFLAEHKNRRTCGKCKYVEYVK